MMTVMTVEKTEEIKLKKSDLLELRQKMVVCSHCGHVFVKEMDDAKVCEPCVKEAMEDEYFKYE